MAQYAQNFSPNKLNLDKAYKLMDANESFFLLNNESGVNVHNGKAANSGKNTPMVANYLACDMELPAGENYNVGRFFSTITNELYCFTYNSNGVNFIWRINGDGSCQIFYSGICLPLSPDPKHEITNWRCYMKLDKICHNQSGKQLIWVDGSDNPIGQLDVEASIATNFFTTPFFDLCPNDCAPLQMCVPEPGGCLHGTFVPYQPSDAALSNNLLDKGFKFMYSFIYYDQRASEYSSWSSLYFQDAKGCFDNNLGQPRCLKFRLPIGNPLVEKIEFCFSDDGGVNWYVSETIEKYKQYNSSQQMWYDRSLSETISSTFSDTDCSFDYVFCNDKQRIVIAPTQVSREYNPMPRSPQGFVPINNNINGLYGLGFYNYLKGNCPIDNNEASKFDVNIICPDNTVSCTPQFAKITVRAIIYNQEQRYNSFIYRTEGGDGAADDTTFPAYFGGIAYFPTPTLSYTYQGFGQTFSGTTRNFIPYIDGTDYFGVMDQWHSGSFFTQTKKVGVIAGLDKQSVIVKKGGDIANGSFYYHEYTFTVPKGTKGYIRLASHHQTDGRGNNQNTSTQVIGIHPDLRTYKGYYTLTTGSPLIDSKEIYVDTCLGDVELFEAFVIADLFNAHGLDTVSSRAYEGYITDANKLPVEGAQIFISGTTFVATTDWNGFYNFYTTSGTSSAINLDIHAEQNCIGDFTLLETFTSQTDQGNIADVSYQIISTDYTNNFYAIVKIPVKDCQNNTISGIRVSING